MSEQTAAEMGARPQKSYAITEYLVTSQTFLVTAGSKDEALERVMSGELRDDIVIVKDYVYPDPRRSMTVELESTWTRRNRAQS